VFSIVIAFTDQFLFYTTISFILGAITSLASGYIGMYVATRANVRVTYMAATYKEEAPALKHAFNTAFKGGLVMGFCLVSLALLVLTGIIYVYQALLKPDSLELYTVMFEYICGYGLGGSSVALFCRVGGGIYTKAADVGADLVGKNDFGLEEDSPKNPATIADNVGDNVGDIAGMGADLFGSFAESTVAALVVSGTSAELIKGANFFYPLLISATGIFVCVITSFFALHITTVSEKSHIESTLRGQLIISSILLTPAIYSLTHFCLPEKVTFTTSEVIITQNWGLNVCCLSGLWSGLIIGYFTDYFTSNAHSPTQELAKSCKSGAAINIIQGLALGYLSCVIPIICIAGTIYVSFKFAGMYGIAIAALGMLSNLCISLAIDAYGPISDNAGGISEMSGLERTVRERTDALDAAGNTTAAIGKGFAIGSACLVSLALFGAFVTRTSMHDVNILEPIEISCLVVGAMIPFCFSALTMKSVGMAAAEMCEQVKKQVQRGENSHEECIKISTNASLKEMILPGILVIFAPLLVGGLFGPKAVAGYLAGIIVSGVQMAISSSNSGGAWDNAKKFIEAKKLLVLEEDKKSKRDKTINETSVFFPKKSKPHKAAVVGDTVGDPLKDTSGPSLNILIKLSAIVSLVFGSYFQKHSIFKV
jgi:H(+)-translocating pyrophosphatase